jgi:type II secretory pathway component PulC
LRLGLKDWLIQLKGGIDEPNLKLWNKALALAAAILFIYLSADFMLRRLDLKQFTRKVSAQKARNFEQSVTPEVRPFSYYLEMVQRRDIFSPVKLKSVEDPEDEAKKAMDALLKDLKLVGISWGNDPEVIIEDVKAGKTYFLKTGDSISSFKVDAILKDKVVLESGGQKTELK